MKISIIVPVYNSEKYISKLINSVLIQDYDNYELILVDDGSTDDSYNLMRKLAGNNKKIKIYHKTNSGPGLTRKFGFEQSNGDLLFFVDSDDWITNENSLKEINEIFENDKKIDVLFFDREDIIDSKKSIIKGFEEIKPGLHKLSELNDFIRPGLGAKILKKEKLRGDMFLDSNVFEDLYTTYMYLDKCEYFYYKNSCYYTIYHEENSESLSNLNNIENSKCLNNALNILINIYKKIDRKELIYSLELRMANLFWIYCINNIKNKKKYNEKFLKENIEIVSKILYKDKIKLKTNHLSGIKQIIYFIKLRKMGKELQ